MNVLEEGLRISHESIYSQALSETCAVWARNLAMKDAGNLVLRIRVIQMGLQASPRNPSLLELLLEISHGLEGREGISAREALVRILAEGAPSALLHFIIGNDALKQGDETLALKHFELAYDQDPQMPAVTNNLAMLLIHREKQDPLRALSLIQTALVKYASDPYLRDTRGQIFVKLGRWKEAVEDLEFALPKLNSRSATHAALAEAYSGLGMQDLAKEHKSLSKY